MIQTTIISKVIKHAIKQTPDCEFCVCRFDMTDDHIYYFVGLDGYWGQNDWAPMCTPPCVVEASEQQPPTRTPDEDIT